MSFLDTVVRAKAYLEDQGRVSLRGLQREFDLADDALEDLCEELVDVQGVAVRSGRVLEWAGSTSAAGSASPAPASDVTRSPRDPISYTPEHLAEKILRSKSALEGERKHVTVLFADVKGSMELAEQVDAEEWHSILDRFFQILADGVHRFEGTVNQYTGDGIMALFGAPISHEDHAQRACYTALHLRDELRGYADELRGTRGLNFSVRIGINSGEVIVGKIGDDLRMDYTAQGHTVGLAARLEQLAEAGTILLSGKTASLVEGYVELEDLGEARLKGVTEPVSTFRLSAVGAMRTRLDVSRARGFSRFVGRTDELATLEAALDRTVAGHGSPLGIAAEAGAGKSRLCFQFLESCRARGIHTNTARGVAHGAGIPYLPIRELFRQFYDIRDDDPPERQREKIAGRLLLLDEGLRDTLPTIFDFLGIADPVNPVPNLDPRARLQQLFSLGRRVMEASSEPGVTLIEDLHWFDEASLEFLSHMVDAAQRSRTLLLLNYRPEFSAPWMTRSSYQQLSLQPLGREAVEELTRDLLGQDTSLDDLARLVEERAGGNPFFIEEIILELAESGVLSGERGAYILERPVDALRVPGSVNALLASRIDRLGEAEKRVLQLAAVVGHRFDEPTLTEALDGQDPSDSLRTLCEGEFVYAEALYPIAEFAFKHALTAQVAYESQLGDARTRSHAAVAAALEALHVESSDDHAAVIAHHWEEAGESLPAARAYVRAAAREGTVGAPSADRHWRKVLALLREVDATAETDRLGATACSQIMNLAWRLQIEEEEMKALYSEGIALAQRLGDPEMIVAVETGYAALSITHGNIARAASHLKTALAVAEGTGDLAMLANIRVSYGCQLELGGRLREAEEVYALAAFDEPSKGTSFWGFDPHLWCQSGRAYARVLQGDLVGGSRDLRRISQVARERGEVETMFNSLNYRGMCAWLAGDARGIEVCLEEMIGVGERLDHPLYAAMLIDHTATGDLLAGRYAKVAEAYSLATHEGGNPQALTYAAIAWLELGDFARAEEILRDLIDVRLVENDYHRLFSQIELARTLIRAGAEARANQIDEELATSEALLETTGGQSLAPRLEEVRAEHAAAHGDEVLAERHLQAAQRGYTKIGAHGHATRLAERLAR